MSEDAARRDDETFRVPVYAMKTVEVTASSERAARQKAMKKVDCAEMEPFTEKPEVLD